MWSMGCTAMAVAAFVGVVWQIKMADLAIAAPRAPVGAVCSRVALVSGAAWGKPMWGPWNWDARLTSELVLPFRTPGHRPVARL